MSVFLWQESQRRDAMRRKLRDWAEKESPPFVQTLHYDRLPNIVHCTRCRVSRPWRRGSGRRPLIRGSEVRCLPAGSRGDDRRRRGWRAFVRLLAVDVCGAVMALLSPSLLPTGVPRLPPLLPRLQSYHSSSPPSWQAFLLRIASPRVSVITMCGFPQESEECTLQ